MSVPGPELSFHPPCTVAPVPPRPLSRDGRLRSDVRAASVAIQVAWLTLVGWLGAALTLLPLALRSAPAGRKVLAGGASVVRLLATAPPREALPR